MVSPSLDEIKDKLTGEIGNFNEKLWDRLVKKIKKEYGIPIFAIISQELSKNEAREFFEEG